MTDQKAQFAKNVAEDINALNARVDELDGKVGTGGGNGLTPHIGDNGNWWIGDTDTLKPARGEQGLQGVRGERGLQGERGAQGERGIQGLQGVQGLQGLPGVKGDAGAKGEQGERGLTGAKGDKGSAGLDGKDGLPGAKGVDGLPGKDGADGKSAYQVAVANGFSGDEAAWLLSLKGEKGDPGSGGSGTDTTALQQEIDALKAVVAKMPKYKEYQAGYIPRADFVGTLANNALITAKYPKPFSKRPILNVTLDIADTAARIQYVNNVTETGFQVATNYASSLYGVWYEAFILEN